MRPAAWPSRSPALALIPKRALPGGRMEKPTPPPAKRCANTVAAPWTWKSLVSWAESGALQVSVRKITIAECRNQLISMSCVIVMSGASEAMAEQYFSMERVTARSA